MFENAPAKNLCMMLYKALLADNRLAQPHNNEIQNEVWNTPSLQQKVIQPLISRLGEQGAIQKFNEIFNAVAEDVKYRYGIVYEDEEEKVLDVKPETVAANDVFIGFEPEEDDEPFKRFKDAGFDSKTGILDHDQFEGEVDWAGSNLVENVVEDVIDWWSGRGADKTDVDVNDGRYDSIDDYVCFYVNEVNLSKHTGNRIPLNDTGDITVDREQFLSMINTFDNPPRVMREDFFKHFANRFHSTDLEYQFRVAFNQIKNEINGTSIPTPEEDTEMFVSPASYGACYP